MEYLFVGIGGAFGAVTRYAAGRWIGGWWKGSFPAATFFVNLTGSLFLGFLAGVFKEQAGQWSNLELMITIGFLGSYTTYSTFSFEILNLVRDHKIGIASIYLMGSLVSGIIFALAGFGFVRFI